MGRTINFDREKTLKVITDLFLKNGYQGTSLSDLVSETGLNKPSLYNSFGNKDEMFLLALESYLENSNSKWKTEFQGLEFI
jgi:AcrR family transcriptional regulator